VLGANVLDLDPQRLLVLLQRLLVSAQILVHQADIVEAPRHVHVLGANVLDRDPQRLLVLLQRLLVSAQSLVHQADIVEARRHVHVLGANVLDLDPQRLLVLLQRLLVSAQILVHQADIVEAPRHVHVLGANVLDRDPQRLLVLLQRLLVSAQSVVHVADIVEARRHVHVLGAKDLRPDGKRLFVLLQRLLVVTQSPVHQPDVAQTRSDVLVLVAEDSFPHPQRLLERVQRHALLALVIVNIADHVEALCHLGVVASAEKPLPHVARLDRMLHRSVILRQAVKRVGELEVAASEFEMVMRVLLLRSMQLELAHVAHVAELALLLEERGERRALAKEVRVVLLGVPDLEQLLPPCRDERHRRRPIELLRAPKHPNDLLLDPRLVRRVPGLHRVEEVERAPSTHVFVLQVPLRGLVVRIQEPHHGQVARHPRGHLQHNPTPLHDLLHRLVVADVQEVNLSVFVRVRLASDTDDRIAVERVEALRVEQHVDPDQRIGVDNFFFR